MQSLFRSFGVFLGLAMIALAQTGPAAAWDRHEITHLSTPVAVDEHHHHDHEGSIVVLGEEAFGSSHHDPDDDRDGGHDHMPSLFAAMSDVPPEGPVFPAYLSESSPPVLASARVPPNLSPAPQIRPPRFA